MMGIQIYIVYFISIAAFLVIPFQEIFAFPLKNEEIESAQRQEFNNIIDYYVEQINKDPKNLKLTLAVGDMYYALKEYTLAIKYYQHAWELDPTNITIKTSLALSYLNNNDLFHSRQLLEEVLQVDPNNPSALSALGRVEALMHHEELAETLYQKALNIAPNNLVTLYYIAELRIDQKKFAEASQILSKLLKENPKANWIKQALKRAELGPIFEETKQLEKQKDFQSAVAIYKEQLDKDPNNLEFYLALGRLYTKMGQEEDAIAILEQGLKLNPHENSLILALGFTYLAKQDLTHAQFFLEKAALQVDGRSEALAGLGRIAALKGNEEAAYQLYQNALEINPLDTLALSYLAQLKIDQKQYQEAQSVYAQILEIDPEATWVRQAIEDAKLAPILNEIRQYEEQQQLDKVEQLYKKLIFIAPFNVDSYIRFGQFYMKQKKYQKALAVYSYGLRFQPNSMQLYTALGYAYLFNKQLNLSQKKFDLVLKHEPQNPEALAGVGRIKAIIGDAEGAADAYEWALTIDPTNMTALSYLLDLRIEQKNYQEAQKILNKILEINPKDKWAQQTLLKVQYGSEIDKAKELENKGNLNQAIAIYQNIAEASPHFEEAYLNLGHLYMITKRYKEAALVYRKGLEENPDFKQLRVNLGLTYLEMKRLKAAERWLSLALKKDAQNADIIAGLGKISELNGNFEEAKRLYKHALKLDPNNLLALSYLGNFWFTQKQFTKAQQVYEKIVKLDPKAIWAKLAIEDTKAGPILEEISEKEQSQDFTNAEKLYLQAIQETPTYIGYYLRLGQLYMTMKQYQNAIDLYLQGLKVQPDSIDLHIGLGFAYLENKNLEEGEIFLKLALKQDPENAEALAGLGRLAELRNHPQDAEVWYQQALKANPNNMTALIYLANLMMAEDRYESAQELYKRAYELEPNKHWIKLAIKDAKHGRLINEIKKKEEAEEYQQAEVLWQQLLQEEPDIGDYYLRMGLFYHRLKQYGKAINTYLEGLKVEPDSSEIYAALGLVYLSEKKLVEARRAFTKSLKLDGKNPDALAGLGYVDFLRGNLQKAEELITTALAIDPNRIAALSALGELRMKQKRYKEAVEVYEKLLVLRPKEKWIKLSLDDAKHGPLLDEIQELIKQEQLAQAAQAYEYLLQESPDNPHYYFGLGQMYMRLKEYERSIEVNLEGLKKNPEANELRVALGYAYFFNQDLAQAREVLTKAVEVDEKDPEALAGLGRVEALEKEYCEAEALYRKALFRDPKNQSALNFYADLLIKQKRYTEAQDLFARLWELLPNAVWVKRAWQDAADGPMMDAANRFADREEFEAAANLYRQLVDASPEDPARYLALGQMYVNLQQYCCGMRIYQEGITLDPEAWYLWRALAFAYIMIECYDSAKSIFLLLIEQDPEDAESWAGLGRIEALNGSICLAEEYYSTALAIAPSNLTVLSFLADLQRDEGYQFSRLATYQNILNAFSDSLTVRTRRPKWMNKGYSDALNAALPTITTALAYHEEDQWDPTVHRWSARYSVYGGKALINYPISDEVTLWGSFANQIYELRDLLTHTNLYSFDVQRYRLGGLWTYSPCLFIEERLGISNYSRYRRSSFHEKTGTLIEPSVTFTYHKPIEKATLSISSDSDLVARNFDTNEAKIVAYYYLLGAYERKLMRRTWAGIEGTAYWYRDFVHNNSQRILGWIQWRPPVYSDNILLRYHTKYQTFAKNIPDYYTYKSQFVNQLQLTLEKYWRVCWADSFYTSLSYGYGIQNTLTRFAEIVVINPTPVPNEEPPLRWDNRRYNILFGSLIYKYDRLQFAFTADYYRDTEKYTMWTVAGELRWRF